MIFYNSLVCSVKIGNVLNENLNSAGVDFKLLEDGKCFLIELGSDCNICNVWGVVVVQSVDVLHHLGLVRLDGCQDQEVL